MLEKYLKECWSQISLFYPTAPGEADHLHLLIDLHPNNNISNLISSLKSASSRILRKKYSPEIAQHYWGKNALIMA